MPKTAGSTSGPGPAGSPVGPTACAWEAWPSRTAFFFTPRDTGRLRSARRTAPSGSRPAPSRSARSRRMVVAGPCSGVLPAWVTRSPSSRWRKSRLRSAVLPFESPRILGALVGSTLATAVVRRGRGPTLGRELGVLVLGLAPALVALRGSDLAAYHGAEHKSIGEFERALAGDSPAEATKEHERCGSNLVGPLAAITLLSNVVLRRVSRRPPAAAVVATSLLSTGAAMEVYRWMSQHPGFEGRARALVAGPCPPGARDHAGALGGPDGRGPGGAVGDPAAGGRPRPPVTAGPRVSGLPCP